MDEIYLDNSQTTRPSEEVISAMMPFFGAHWGVLSTPHKRGQALAKPSLAAYRELYTLCDASEEDQVIFTSSGAEAINQAIFSTYTEVALPTGKNQFVTSLIDEAPTMMAIGRLEKLGAVVKYAKPNREGVITADAIADQLTPRTALVSLSWGNGLTGVIQPVEEIATLCQERGVLLHLDASHTFGKLTFENRDVGADYISFNGDHFHAPAGTGGLFIKKGTAAAPLIAGGLEQGGLRAGNFSVASLIGLGEAAKMAIEAKEYICTEIARLRTLFETLVDGDVLFQKSRRLPHISCVSFPGVVNEALLFALNQKEVFACMGGGSFQQISLNLEACEVESEKAKSALSFSLSRETTEGEIRQAVEVVNALAKRLCCGT